MLLHLIHGSLIDESYYPQFTENEAREVKHPT